MSLNRRHLFGLLGGAAVAPLLPSAAPAVAPIVTRYAHRTYGLGYAVTREDLTEASLERCIADAKLAMGSNFHTTLWSANA